MLASGQAGGLGPRGKVKRLGLGSTSRFECKVAGLLAMVGARGTVCALANEDSKVGARTKMWRRYRSGGARMESARSVDI